jgi:hypothetical protein
MITKRTQRVIDRAWELHRENGHPKGYEGPCWGPTLMETIQAQNEIREEDRAVQE